MLRRAGIFATLLVLTACAGASDLSKPAVPLGDFSLGHNIVVAPKAATLAVSREVPKEELTAALKRAIAERFDRYDGPKDYHFGVSVEAYVLAKPGIPVLLAPKSAMIILLTVWDDAEGKKLNAEPKQITVLEELSGETILGTGWTQDAETQLRNLSQNASQAIESYLVTQRNEAGWFGGSEARVSEADAADIDASLVAETATASEVSDE